MNPFLVTVEPDDNPNVTKNSHKGQEFNYVVEGQLELHIGNNILKLAEGDSIIFDSDIPHGMKALGGKRVKFLALII